MTTNHTRAPEDPNSPARSRESVPVFRSRVGGPIAFVGLAVALLSLVLPWVSGGGQSITGLGLTDALGLRGFTPVNFVGLVVMAFLASVTLVARLGIFAILNAITAALVLVAHLVFVWVLYNSTGNSEPILSGLPAETSVSYGPYIAVIGFVLVIVGSVVAARSAEYLLPDRAEGRLPRRD